MCLKVAEVKRRTGEPNEDEYITRLLVRHKEGAAEFLDLIKAGVDDDVVEIRKSIEIEVRKADYALSAYA